MKKTLLFLITLILLFSCDNSKWEIVKGLGINDEPKSIEDVIYFEDENNGVVGGYTLIEDNHAQNDVKLSSIPTLFLTHDAGKNWREISFTPSIKKSVQNVYLHLDTLICQIDSVVLFSQNKGNSFEVLTDSVERSLVVNKYLNSNRSEITNDKFVHNGENYTVKERYENRLATVVVCWDLETLTDYYFVSFDEGKNWTFLQKEFGDNRQRFLLEDKYLYRYKFPFGLQRLRLK